MYPLNNGNDEENEQGVYIGVERFRHIYFEFSMYNRNQRRGENGAASLEVDDVQATVAGFAGQNTYQFEWNQCHK